MEDVGALSNEHPNLVLPKEHPELRQIFIDGASQKRQC